MKKVRIRRFFAIIIGLALFLAGVFKLIDPVGSGLIVGEYFKFFHLGFLGALSKPFAVALSLTEAVTGAALITGVFRRAFSWITIVLMGFFTLVTLVLWIFNPSMDCGCFGEVVHLTHFQTFLKNIVLCAFAAVAFFPMKDFGEASKKKLVTFSLEVLMLVVFGGYCLLYIPPVDFTAFNLSAQLADPSSFTLQTQDEFVTSFIYEKNGHEGSFNIEHLPDSTWTYVRTETIQKENYIHNTDYPLLSFTDSLGSYRDSLALKGLVMAVSAYRPSKLREDELKSIAMTLQAAASEGFTPLLLLACTPEDLASMTEKLPEPVSEQLLRYAYFADYKTLISLNRSNGGATFIHDGDLIQKWAHRELPSDKKLHKLSASNSVSLMINANAKGRMKFQAFLLYSFVLFII